MSLISKRVGDISSSMHYPTTKVQNVSSENLCPTNIQNPAECRANFKFATPTILVKKVIRPFSYVHCPCLLPAAEKGGRCVSDIKGEVVSVTLALGALNVDAAGHLNVLCHEGRMLVVDGKRVCIVKKTYYVHFGGLFESEHLGIQSDNPPLEDVSRPHLLSTTERVRGNERQQHTEVQDDSYRWLLSDNRWSRIPSPPSSNRGKLPDPKLAQ